jgi:hypothetical protein
MAASRGALWLAAGGGLGAAAMFAATLAVGGAAWRAWLGAAALWAGAAAAAVALNLMIRLIPGGWREALGAPLTAAGWTLAPAALAMAPVLLAPRALYAWAQRPMGGDSFRAAWLTPGFFLGRSVIWFALLGWLAWRRRRGPAGAPTAVLGLIAYTLLGAIMAVDWLMSLDADFASSGFGLYVLGLMLSFALALATVAAVRDGADARQRNAMASVLFSLVAIWAYLGFMQYFITWSGDLPSGVHWYLRRGGDWAGLAWAAIVLRAIPGVLLVFAPVRRSARALTVTALAVAAGAAPEMAWLVLPGVEPAASGWDVLLFAVEVLLLGAAMVGVYGLARPQPVGAP